MRLNHGKRVGSKGRARLSANALPLRTLLLAFQSYISCKFEIEGSTYKIESACSRQWPVCNFSNFQIGLRFLCLQARQ